ncbi:unnamed protein product, partial [Pylaiella littoralis]
KTCGASSFVTQRIRREFGSAVAYDATVFASYSEEVEDVLRGLVSSQPLINLCHAQAGTELVDLEVTTGRTRED